MTNHIKNSGLNAKLGSIMSRDVGSFSKMRAKIFLKTLGRPDFKDEP